MWQHEAVFDGILLGLQQKRLLMLRFAMPHFCCDVQLDAGKRRVMHRSLSPIPVQQPGFKQAIEVVPKKLAMRFLANVAVAREKMAKTLSKAKTKAGEADPHRLPCCQCLIPCSNYMNCTTPLKPRAKKS
jgi:hypothetical protein